MFDPRTHSAVLHRRIVRRAQGSAHRGIVVDVPDRPRKRSHRFNLGVFSDPGASAVDLGDTDAPGACAAAAVEHVLRLRAVVEILVPHQGEGGWADANVAWHRACTGSADGRSEAALASQSWPTPRTNASASGSARHKLTIFCGRRWKHRAPNTPKSSHGRSATQKHRTQKRAPRQRSVTGEGDHARETARHRSCAGARAPQSRRGARQARPGGSRAEGTRGAHRSCQGGSRPRALCACWRGGGGGVKS